MKLFTQKIKPAWTFRTDKNVWRLFPGSGVLTTELRDTEAKTAEYAGIDIESGSILWEGLKFDDSWWVTMNRIFRDVLLLQQFVRPDMPTPGKVFAVDLFTGKILWGKEDLSFIAAAGDFVYGLRKSIDSEDIVGVDYRTGDERTVFPADDPRVNEIEDSAMADYFTPPSFIEEIEEALPSELLKKVTNTPPADAVNPTYIASGKGMSIAGFHTSAGKDNKGAPVFDSHIIVIDENGKSIYEDIADRGVYTAMGDFYFVADGRLFYVRNSKEIVVVRLS